MSKPRSRSSEAGLARRHPPAVSRLVLFGLTWLFVLVAATPAVEPLGRMRALLIGVDEYYQDVDLSFPGNDVRLLEHTLKAFCDCDSFHVMTQDQQRPDQPDFGKIVAALRQEVTVANSGHYDSLVIFFAGHGLRGRDGQLYLAPGDYVPGLLERTGIPINMVRDTLASCNEVTNRFLILDTCHAAAQPAAREIADALQDTRGLVTFASCRPGETSIEWRNCQHGLFTYWFCVGLSGWADRAAPDGVVDVRELDEFVREMVRRSLEEFSSRTEQPLVQQPELLGLDKQQTVPFARVDHRVNQRQVDDLLDSALLRLKNQRPVDAITSLNKALDHKPWDPTLCALRGKAYQRMYEDGKRMEHLERALADLDTAILLKRHCRQLEELNEIVKLRASILPLVEGQTK